MASQGSQRTRDRQAVRRGAGPRCQRPLRRRMKMKRGTVIRYAARGGAVSALALATLLAFAAPAWAADGDLDTSFSDDGYRTQNRTAKNDEARSLAFRSDGSVVVGECRVVLLEKQLLLPAERHEHPPELRGVVGQLTRAAAQHLPDARITYSLQAARSDHLSFALEVRSPTANRRLPTNFNAVCRRGQQQS